MSKPHYPPTNIASVNSGHENNINMMIYRKKYYFNFFWKNVPLPQTTPSVLVYSCIIFMTK